MSGKKISTTVNDVIRGLPRRTRDRLLALCTPVDLVFGAILCEPDKRLRHVYFPLTGFISLMTTISGHPPLEMGLIGNEGMLGATLALGVNSGRLHGVVQGSGTALRMTAPDFMRELRTNATLRKVVDRYLYVLLAQLSQTAACNCFHETGARLARWLLMTHDRAHADHFYLTHQYLADMLGMQRSAATIAAGKLQRQKLIRYARGKITIVNRAGLEAASCECYAALIEDQKRLSA